MESAIDARQRLLGWRSPACSVIAPPCEKPASTMRLRGTPRSTSRSIRRSTASADARMRVLVFLAHEFAAEDVVPRAHHVAAVDRDRNLSAHAETHNARRVRRPPRVRARPGRSRTRRRPGHAARPPRFAGGRAFAVRCNRAGRTSRVPRLLTECGSRPSAGTPCTPHRGFRRMARRSTGCSKAPRQRCRQRAPSRRLPAVLRAFPGSTSAGRAD